MDMRKKAARPVRRPERQYPPTFGVKETYVPDPPPPGAQQRRDKNGPELRYDPPLAPWRTA